MIWLAVGFLGLGCSGGDAGTDASGEPTPAPDPVLAADAQADAPAAAPDPQPVASGDPAELADDNQAWLEARPSKCALPSLATDCDGVRGYLEVYPEGAHAEEAREILEKSRRRIEILQEARDAIGGGVEDLSACMANCRKAYAGQPEPIKSQGVRRCIKSECR